MPRSTLGAGAASLSTSSGPTRSHPDPAAVIAPGERTGRYHLGGDQLVVNENGVSEISAEEYATAVADRLEQGDRTRQRVSVAS